MFEFTLANQLRFSASKVVPLYVPIVSELNKLKFPFNLTFRDGVKVKLNSVPTLLFSDKFTGLSFKTGTSNTSEDGLSGSPEIITFCPVSCCMKVKTLVDF